MDKKRSKSKKKQAAEQMDLFGQTGPKRAGKKSQNDGKPRRYKTKRGHTYELRRVD